MRNIINKQDGDGNLKLFNGLDVQSHWDGFFRPEFYYFQSHVVFWLEAIVAKSSRPGA